VENKPGANAAIGIEALLRSDPDGHTSSSSRTARSRSNVHLSRLNYDPLTDLVPVFQGGEQPDHPDRQCRRSHRCRLVRGLAQAKLSIRDRCGARLVGQDVGLLTTLETGTKSVSGS